MSAATPTYDPLQAEQLLGRYVLVALTFLDENDEPVEHRQMHGDVVRIDPAEGIFLRLRPGGEEFWLPPFTSTFEEAELGGYELTATGEVVNDPDYVAQWTLKPPAEWADGTELEE